MSELVVSRSVELADTLRIARARSMPNLGPRLLFFSGGSALNEIARQLKLFTHNSVHLVTPFDSGGSSQVLREAFDMPAVGDLRSRLMALADETVLGQPDIYRLFSYRLPSGQSPAGLEAEFHDILAGNHSLMKAISQPMRNLILSQLRNFERARSTGFRFEGASVGNLILAGGYLQNQRALEPVSFLMSKMVAVQGTVRVIVDRNLDIGAELFDGSLVPTQRLMTGKETTPIASPIKRLFLSENGRELDRDDVVLPKRNRKLIEQADLICYPPGSFYSSVLANLLPRRVGQSIAARKVPKVYTPSLGEDPECKDMTLLDQVDALMSVLREDAGKGCPVEDLLSVILCDKDHFDGATAKKLKSRYGIPCVPCALRQESKPDRYDPERFCNALISLA